MIKHKSKKTIYPSFSFSALNCKLAIKLVCLQHFWQLYANHIIFFAFFLVLFSSLSLHCLFDFFVGNKYDCVLRSTSQQRSSESSVHAMPSTISPHMIFNRSMQWQ